MSFEIITQRTMQFKYRAIKNGQIESKIIDAASQEDAVAFLRGKEYFIINVKASSGSGATLFERYFDRVTFNDVVDLTRQLAIMLNAGLTLIEAIIILRRQITKESLRKVVVDIENQIRGGNSMSFVLMQYPQYFPNLYIALVKSGEASGKLADILLKLSENLEKQREFRGKLRSALIYPAVIIVAMIGVMFVMITFVIPKLLDLYKNFQVELPLSTKILIAVSSFSATYWPLIIIAVVGGVIAVRQYLRTKQGKYMKDSIVIKLPTLKNVIRMASLVDSTRTLAILIGSGVSILEALSIVIETTDNVVYKESFMRVYKKIEKGQSLGSAFGDEPLFPPILTQMAIVGENTGHLDDTLSRLSKYFEFESELAIKTMTTLIEPAILLVLGASVGGLVFSIITPIYNLTTSIK